MVQRLSLGQMLLTHTRETLIGVGLVVTATVSIYITFTYLVTYSTQILKLPLNQTFLVQMVGAGLMVLLTPFMGAWSDRVGRRPIVIGSLIGYLLVLYPLYAWLTDAPSISRLLTVQVVVCFFVSAFFGVFSTVMAELFPARVRSVGLSLAYNVARDDLRRLRPVHRDLADHLAPADRAGGGVLLRVGLLRRVQHGHGRAVPGTRALGRPVAGL